MSININIDVQTQVIENAYNIGVLEKTVELLLSRFPTFGGPPISPQEMDNIKREVIQKLQTKYPDLGIALIEKTNA